MSKIEQLEYILGLTRQRIWQLAEDGVIPKPKERGDYDIHECVKKYYEYLHEVGGDEELDGKYERARKAKAEADRIEMDLAIKRGQVHSSEDVEAVLNDMIAFFRAKMLSMPTKLAPILAAELNPRIIKKKLDDEIYEALSELSEYDPQYFHSKSTDYCNIPDFEKQYEEKSTEKEGKTRKRVQNKK